MAVEDAGIGTISPVVSGGLAHVFDTTGAYVAGKLASFQNNAVEKASIGFDGSFTGAAGSFTTLAASSSISVGTNPATTGTVNLPNNENISWRNAANAADIRFARLNGADTFLLDPDAVGVSFAGTLAVTGASSMAALTTTGLLKSAFAATDKLLEIVGTGTGGTYMKFNESGTKAWTVGIDDADSSLKFREDSTSGTVALTLDASSGATFAGTLTSTGLITATAGLTTPGVIFGSATGTAAAPSYSFQGFSDDGLFLAADGELAWTSGGVERMRLTPLGLELGTATLSNGAANRLDLASGDSLHLVSGGIGVGIVNTVAGTIQAKVSDTLSTGQLKVEQGSTGDAAIQFLLTGVRSWYMGIDNSDSDNFKINPNSGLGNTDTFVISQAGDVSFLGDLIASTAGTITFKEITTPSALADHGRIYSKTDNLLYFQDGAGTEHTVSLVDVISDYAGMEVTAGSTATVIPLADSWVKVAVFTADTPEAVSNADFTTDIITVGATGNYEIAFDTAASAATNNQIIHVAAFDTAASGTTITGATAANPVVITAVGHTLTNGQKVKISGVVGMVELNDRIFTVAGVIGNNFNLQDDGGTNIDGTGFTAYTSGGAARLAMDTGIHSIRKYGTGGDVGAQASSNIGALVSGDTIELYAKNMSSTANITIEEANFFIHRVG